MEKVKKQPLTRSEMAPNIIIHKKSAVRFSNAPFSNCTPYLALYAKISKSISNNCCKLNVDNIVEVTVQ
jgi:hypothetical protein